MSKVDGGPAMGVRDGVRWQSNAMWSSNVYLGTDGKCVSTDTHLTQEEALAVCNALNREGFGGLGKDFPIETWVNRIAARETKS